MNRATLLSKAALVCIEEKICKTLMCKQSERQRTREDSYKVFLTKHTVKFQNALVELFHEQEQEMLLNIRQDKSYDLSSGRPLIRRWHQSMIKDAFDLMMIDMNTWNDRFANEYATYASKAYVDNGQRMLGDLCAHLKTRYKRLKKEPAEDDSPPLGFEVAASFDVDQADVAQYIDDTQYHFAETVNGYTEEKMRAILKQSAEEGLSVARTADLIIDFFNGDLDRALKIAQTEMARAAVNGARAAYKQSGVVESIEWITASDERVCAFCSRMDNKVATLTENFFDLGQTFDAGDNQKITFNYSAITGPPLHPRCRCDIVPIIKDTYGKYFDAMT